MGRVLLRIVILLLAALALCVNANWLWAKEVSSTSELHTRIID